MVKLARSDPRDPAIRNDQFRSPTSHQFSGSNLWALLQLRARVSGNERFMTWHPFEGPGRAWTYAQFARDAAALAAGMQRRGIKAGDPVLIHLENCPEFLLAWFGCAAIGAVAVTTNTRSSADELGFYADHCRAVAAITQPRFVSLVAKSSRDLRWMVCLDHDAGVPVDAAQRPDSASSFKSLLADPNELIAAAPDPWAPMSVQYTSGTTSRPKGVLWTHANVLWAAKTHAGYEDLHASDRHLVFAPLFHTNALAFSMLPTLWAGASFTLIPKWSSSRFWDISVQHAATWISLIGPCLVTLATVPAPPNHSYRMFGGPAWDDPPHPGLAGIKTLPWWGMTETVGAAIVGDALLPNRSGGMGRPAPGYGIAVVRDDGVTPVEPEETGHLLVKGTPGLSLFAEYLHNPQATRESFDEWGWFRTGDLVTAHSDGHLSFADRSKDMLKVGGENVAASEIERAIYSVAEVYDAAVVGRPETFLEEVPVAFVLAPGADAQLAAKVVTACRSMLADFKVPRDVYVVRELPRSTLGKINKVELRKFTAPDADRAAAELRWMAEAKVDPSGDAQV
jgi:crotonobetaine/carnitine-CoA ligase